MPAYSIGIYHKAIKQFEKIPKNERKTIGVKIEGLKTVPRPPGAIKLVNEELYRMRVGNYRVLYTVDDPLREVTVIAVKHRSEVYRGL
ncbi:MAG: type II toxin-antitoxin system RelE/ParE family toxin [Spirochaetia bacterium]|nr:type II toxin-antitoxin system RelE/ParE family toxin [Spirochaetia bacterium]